MPDLVARLSGLHNTITTRLSLQESLLSLSGRLDMVLSQVEMRSSVAPAPLAPRAGRRVLKESDKVTRYVEGESEEEEEKMEVAVEKDSGDEAGSVEDVELGGESPGEESEEGSEEESASDSSDGEEPTVNGFIDDEAEEYSDEDEDESGEEEEEDESD
jgi:U3 small nucleolar RNA-associated protein 5